MKIHPGSIENLPPGVELDQYSERDIRTEPCTPASKSRPVPMIFRIAMRGKSFSALTQSKIAHNSATIFRSKNIAPYNAATGTCVWSVKYTQITAAIKLDTPLRTRDELRVMMTPFVV